MSMERVMDGLYQTEKGAEEVIRLRKKLVILDKQRQEGRMALRNLKTQCQDIIPMWFGNMFIHLPQSKVKEIINKDMDVLKNDLEDTRNELHNKVRDFQDMQFQDEWKGFDLKALDKDEMSAIRHGQKDI